MREEIKHELINRIIPFWDKLADKEHGGFFCYVSHDLIVNESTFRSAILHSRILWFYSNCYLALREEERAVADKCLETAKFCYDFILKFIDKESDGIFWSVNGRGVPANPMKHAYNHAFFVYALSSYYDATKDSTALNNAMRIFEVLETKMSDKIGYRECCDRDWNLMDNDELSENGIKTEKTMNTILHLIEAYTELYRVGGKNGDVLGRIRSLLQLTYERIYDPSRRQLRVFFDRDFNELGRGANGDAVHSYGHDIEAAWLLGRTLDIADDELPYDLVNNIRDMNKALVERINEVAFCENGTKSMYYESVNGNVNRNRTWWVQAEGLVGFLDAFKRYGDKEYLDRAQGLWEYIKACVIDKRAGSEWFAELNNDHAPDTSMPMADEWKCPYHNGRMCIEALASL
jgi:mannobiose 2-epimerase